MQERAGSSPAEGTINGVGAILWPAKRGRPHHERLAPARLATRSVAGRQLARATRFRKSGWLAQLVRALRLHRRGLGFESLTTHQPG